MISFQLEEIENGTITVNGNKVPPDFVLNNNQLIVHRCHRYCISRYFSGCFILTILAVDLVCVNSKHCQFKVPPILGLNRH